jgi:serine/threonine protein kinase
MRYVHSTRIVHGDLTPDNILLDWDWTPRVADFGHSRMWDQLQLASPIHAGAGAVRLYPDFHYLAPECYEDQRGPASDVFAFGLILYEIVVGQSAFPKSLNRWAIVKRLLMEEALPAIPSLVLPAVRALIRDCWAFDPDERPTFCEVVELLESMRFKVMPDVDSRKVELFVKKVQDLESR